MADKLPVLNLLTNIAYDLTLTENQQPKFSGSNDYGRWWGYNLRVPLQVQSMTGRGKKGEPNVVFTPGEEVVYFATESVHEKLQRGGAVLNSHMRLWKEQQGDQTPIRVWVNQEEVTGEAPAAGPQPPDTAPMTDPTQFDEPPEVAEARHETGTPSYGHRPPLQDAPAAAAYATLLMAAKIAKEFDEDRETRTGIFLTLKDVNYQPTPKMIDCAAKKISTFEQEIENLDPEDLPF